MTNRATRRSVQKAEGGQRGFSLARTLGAADGLYFYIIPAGVAHQCRGGGHREVGCSRSPLFLYFSFLSVCCFEGESSARREDEGCTPGLHRACPDKKKTFTELSVSLIRACAWEGYARGKLSQRLHMRTNNAARRDLRQGRPARQGRPKDKAREGATVRGRHAARIGGSFRGAVSPKSVQSVVRI